MNRSSQALPDGWAIEAEEGFGPFVTRVVFRLQDGATRVWSSRYHRKHDAEGSHQVPARTWWIASLFAVGSSCFALGSLPAYFDAVSARTDAITFFVGSILFTSAAYLSYVEVCGTSGSVAPEARRVLRLFSWKPRSIDWWSTWIQLAGTVAFNVTTFAAIRTDWSLEQAKRFVWRPDVVGSICFLVSSWLAWAEVSDGSWSWKPRSTSWWIVALNLLGSVFFGLSAVGAKVLPDGEMRSVPVVNLGTFIGAVCFLCGAALLVAEARFESPDA